MGGGLRGIRAGAVQGERFQRRPRVLGPSKPIDKATMPMLPRSRSVPRHPACVIAKEMRKPLKTPEIRLAE